VSSPENPAAEIIPPAVEPAPPVRQLAEDPVWSGWEVLGVAVFTFAAVVFFLFASTLVAQRLFYPRQSFLEVAQHHPLLIILGQGLAYLAVFVFMVQIVKRGSGRPFWQSVGWNWPANPWAYIVGGVGLALGLQLLGRFLPMPRELPIDRFFRTPAEAWVLAAFGLLVAPLMEELFFRGFLYPVLARRLGIAISVVLTGLGFGLIHASQLGKAWAPVLIVFLVGVVLTVVRAATKSVAAGVLVHFAYNGTIFGLMFAVTGGFRHLERLNP
jgi:hypothetical protein